MSWIDSLALYWSDPILASNAIIMLNLFGALLLGLTVGYERSYHGRAAGMRIYGIVCMASAALTIIGAYPQHWFGGHLGAVVGSDPTRIIQGIVTGIGFLGAGVIMHEGFNISGLTTAASLWASSVIGIMFGIGFYMAAILLAFCSAISMIWIPKLERRLPSRHAIAVTLRFKPDVIPDEAKLRSAGLQRGYEIADGSLSINHDTGMAEWRFVAIKLSKDSGVPLSALARDLAAVDGIDGFQLSHARN
jgi:putative Mg2+ transporter-C (MgtC) family protein